MMSLPDFTGFIFNVGNFQPGFKTAGEFDGSHQGKLWEKRGTKKEKL